MKDVTEEFDKLEAKSLDKKDRIVVKNVEGDVVEFTKVEYVGQPFSVLRGPAQQCGPTHVETDFVISKIDLRKLIGSL